MARRPDVPCSRCGTLMWGGSTSLPAGQRTCHPCRRITPAPRALTVIPADMPCPGCSKSFRPKPTRGSGIFTKTCSKSCASVVKWRSGAMDVRRPRTATPKRAEADRRRRRYERECAAAGLTERQRKELRERWRRQGRACAYCRVNPCETLDHVVPLDRGGTNYEGNLAPACRSCNASKRNLLLVEWRRADEAQLRLLRSSLRRAAA